MKIILVNELVEKWTSLLHFPSNNMIKSEESEENEV